MESHKWLEQDAQPHTHGGSQQEAGDQTWKVEETEASMQQEFARMHYNKANIRGETILLSYLQSQCFEGKNVMEYQKYSMEYVDEWSHIVLAWY